MQAEVRGPFRTTRAPSRGHAHAPNPVSGKALPVARRGPWGSQSRRIFMNLPGPVRINHSLSGRHPRGLAPVLPVGF